MLPCGVCVCVYVCVCAGECSDCVCEVSYMRRRVLAVCDSLWLCVDRFGVWCVVLLLLLLVCVVWALVCVYVLRACVRWWCICGCVCYSVRVCAWYVCVSVRVSCLC